MWQPLGTLEPSGPAFPHILFIQNPVQECLSHDQVTHASGSANECPENVRMFRVPAYAYGQSQVLPEGVRP
jgi:hypothetical protein